MASINDNPRSAHHKPFQVVDEGGPGVELWTYNFVRDGSVDSVISGCFVDAMGMWYKFRNLTISSAPLNFVSLCAAANIPWSDQYIGVAITLVSGGGFYTMIGAPYSGAIPTAQAADSVSCPHVAAGTYNDNPKTLGRVYKP